MTTTTTSPINAITENTIKQRIHEKIKRYKEQMDKPIEDRDVPQFYLDIWRTILDDSWMAPVIWGQPRTGKTTAALRAALDVYGDRDKALQCVVFTLPGLLQRMQKKEPHTIESLNGLHQRVPFLIGDDWAANNNKAETQYRRSWDIFKGAFDTLGTKMGIFAITLNNPSGITDQLQAKYTHEIYVEKRGIAKYDMAEWRQNFYGWSPMQSKKWTQTYEFEELEPSMYKEYDEMRKALVDEIFQRINDSMIEDEGLRTFKRLTEIDVEFIELLVAKGRISKDEMNKPENYRFKEVLTRCKGRNIVVPTRKGTAYWYDLTDFGYELYKLIRVKQQEGVFVTNDIQAPPTE